MATRGCGSTSTWGAAHEPPALTKTQGLPAAARARTVTRHQAELRLRAARAAHLSGQGRPAPRETPQPS
ncbi:hypothetical protein D621_21690 [beta proteobacterium AAP51]|nr:hypothetical protein D621_21690 [beta proteobacterium AAP51]